VCLHLGLKSESAIAVPICSQPLAFLSLISPLFVAFLSLISPLFRRCYRAAFAAVIRREAA
jgi:hypothetical protein